MLDTLSAHHIIKYIISIIIMLSPNNNILGYIYKILLIYKKSISYLPNTSFIFFFASVIDSTLGSITITSCPLSE